MSEDRINMAYHAYRTVPAYRRLLEKKGMQLNEIGDADNWENIPLIEKSDAVMNPEKMISEEYLGLLATGRLLRTHTSGSTGTYLDVYWEETDYQNSLLPLWVERWKTAGIHPRDKVCFFNTVLENDQEYKYDKNALIISKSNLDDAKLRFIYNKIVDFSPKWILIHPGIASVLCSLIEEEQLPVIPSVRYVELTGEMVLDQLKKRIERDFSCIVKCHYGTMEVSTIGYEYDRGYRLYKESTFVEILDNEGNPVRKGECGNIYVTSLHNHAMPFVRYGIGDYGKLLEKEGDDKKQILELTRGRKNDWLTLPDGKRIPPDILLKPVEVLNERFENVVYQFQTRQKGKDQLQMHVVMDSEFEPEEFIRYYKELLTESWMSQMQIEFVFSDKIQPGSDTGKICWFLSEVD